MAILGKIRQRSGILIAIIAFSLFAFVAQDLFKKGDFNSASKYVGSVNGTDIDYQKFNEKVINLEKSQRGATSIQAANQVWNQEIELALLTAEFDKLGLRVGKNHLIDGLKQNPNIGQNKMFQNEAGLFDTAKYNDYFKTNPEAAANKITIEEETAISAKYQIYSTLLKAGFLATKAEAKLKYETETNKVSFDYVTVPFTSIKDSEVKISDDEINAYVKNNEKKYKAEATKELQYVLVEEKASASDEAEIKTAVNALLTSKEEFDKTSNTTVTRPSFAQATNVAEFVNANSDKAYDSTYIAKKDLPAIEADKLFNLPQGSIYGPYMAGQYYCLSKSMGKKNNVNAKASHVLIGWEGSKATNQKEKRTKEQAKAKAEMLLAQAITNPNNFMMLAFQYSDDSSAQSGGDLGYFSQGQMVKNFNDFVFNNGVGKIGMVETEFGYHIINITDKQDAVRLATIARKIEPSEKTSSDIYSLATKFEMNANEKSFDAVAKELKLAVVPGLKVKALDENLGILGNQRQIVRWAFSKETNINDVKRFEIPNLGHIIAKVVKETKEGLMTAEDARLSIESILRNKKKTVILKQKLKGTTLEAIAKANAVTIATAADLTVENPNIPNSGQEFKVVGTALNLATNKISQPIEGNSGVYVVKTKAVAKAPALKDYSPYLAKLKGINANKGNNVVSALKADATIKDNRGDFNY